MKTDFLFARPSPWYGLGRLLAAGTFTQYNRCRTPELADALAVYSDWRMVGDDIIFAMHHCELPPGDAPEPKPTEAAPEQLELHLHR